MEQTREGQGQEAQEGKKKQQQEEKQQEEHQLLLLLLLLLLPQWLVGQSERQVVEREDLRVTQEHWRGVAVRSAVVAVGRQSEVPMVLLRMIRCTRQSCCSPCRTQG